MSELLVVLLIVVLFVAVIAGLAQDIRGLYIGCKDALQRNTTRDFVEQASKHMGGFELTKSLDWPVLLAVYLLISLVVSFRLVCGISGRLTGRNVRYAVIGAFVPTILLLGYVGLADSVSKGVLIGLLVGIVFCASAGLSYPPGDSA